MFNAFDLDDVAIGGLRSRLTGLQVSTALLRLHVIVKAGFRQTQRRVPSGRPDGGQWVGEGVRPILVQSRAPRRSGGNSGNRTPPTNLSQETRLEISLMQMRTTVREAQSIDPSWRPRAQAYESVEANIRANEATRFEAELRIFELTGRPPRLGPFARQWIPSPPPGKSLTAEELRQLDLIGRMFGCHGCGSVDNLSRNGHFYGDHQISKALGIPKIVIPHCPQCSGTQGWLIMQHLGRTRSGK